MFDKFPYTNFHELNLDYFINKFNEIFTEWEQLNTTMLEWKAATDASNALWKTSVENGLAAWKTATEADLNARETALRAELAAWKTATETDIGTWEADTLAALNAWKATAEATFEAIRVQAAASATAAQTAQTAAETAQTAAETAQTAAETAAARVSASAAQIATNTDDISDLKTQLDDISTIVESVNLLNLKDENFIEGYYINNSSGALLENGSYNTTGFIKVEPGGVYVFSVANVRRPMRFICAYDSNKNVLPTKGSSASVDSFTIQSDVAFIRFSASKDYLTDTVNAPAFYKDGTMPGYAPYFEPYIKIQNNVSIEKNKSITIKYPTLNSNNMKILSAIDNKKNNIIEFVGYFSQTPEWVVVGHGIDVTYGSRCIVTSENIEIYNGVTLSNTIPHGLTLSDFIHILIKQNDQSAATIQITTSTGQFSSNSVNWAATRGTYEVAVSGNMTDCAFSVSLTDMQNDIYLFGDSYIGTYNLERYPYYLIINGFTKFLADGYPGRNSEDAMISFMNTMRIGQPRYAIWALGMNDGDTDGINSSWLANVEQFLSFCDANKITPILTTTPNTPTVKNTYKNAYVKNSGRRFIDFAKAVGAETEGSTWYAGMLNQDNVHPTVLGAKALYARFLIDVPEIM